MILKQSDMKLFVIVTTCLFCFFSIFIPSVAVASKFSFAKLLVKKNKRHLTKIAKNLDDTNLHRAVPSASALSK